MGHINEELHNIDNNFMKLQADVHEEEIDANVSSGRMSDGGA